MQRKRLTIYKMATLKEQEQSRCFMKRKKMGQPLKKCNKIFRNLKKYGLAKTGIYSASVMTGTPITPATCFYFIYHFSFSSKLFSISNILTESYLKDYGILPVPMLISLEAAVFLPLSLPDLQTCNSGLAG